MNSVVSRVLCLVLLIAGTVFGQRDLGTVLGTVTDGTGAVVPAASVRIINQQTGQVITVETNESGVYLRPAILPGVYNIEVEATGFKKSIQQNVRVTAGDRIQVNIVLEVGAVTESIEVTTAPPALQTESTIIGAQLETKSIRELPLGGQRKFTFLARLSPGVVPSEPGARDAAGGGFSANGVRSNGQNNFLLNGVDNNVNVIDFINQTAYVVGPSVEAIGEMKVMTNGYNAEYGRGAGGVVNVTIKSGSNDLHGVIFEFLQNSKLNANKWENNRGGVARGPFKQNQFGAAVGGRIIKDKLFWFADYQGTRIRSTGGAVPGLGNTFTRTIPTPAMIGGDFSRLLTGATATNGFGRAGAVGGIYDPLTETVAANGDRIRQPFAGNRIPVSRFDPASAKLAALFPAPNQNLGDAIPNNNYITITSGRQNNDQGDLRMDFLATQKDTIFGSLSWSEEDKFQNPPLPGLLDSGGFAGQSENNKSRNAMLSWTRVWQPTVITETRLAFTRLKTQRTQANSDVDAFAQLGIGGLNPFQLTSENGGLMSINFDRYSGVGGSEWLPTTEFSNVWDFIENVSWNKGNHAMKFGFEYRPIDFPFFQVPTPRGRMDFKQAWTSAGTGLDGPTGDGFASFLLGNPGGTTRITTANFISSQKSAWAGFAQDDWKVTPKLTVNIGIRYELFSPISEKFGRQSNLVYSNAFANQVTLVIPEGRNSDAPLPPNFASAYPNIAVQRGQASKYLISWDKTNFSPRIGMAYKVMDKTVFRAGYGIFYGGEENQGGNPNRGESVPFNAEVRMLAQTDFDQNPFTSGFSAGFPTNIFSQPAQISFRSVYPNWRNPLVHKWNAAIQREVGWGTVLELSYIGSRGARLVQNWDPNAPVNDYSAPGLAAGPRRPYNYALGNVGISDTSAFGISRYNALAAKFEKRFSNGLDFLASYTWGHALSNVGTTLSGGPTTRNAQDFSDRYANASFDVRHSFVYSFLYDLPFGRGKQFGSTWNPAVNAVLGGWQMNGILTLRTGFWRNIESNKATCSCNAFTPDVVQGKNPNNAPSGGRNPELWFDTSAVQFQAAGTYGNLAPMSVVAPGTRNLDFSLFKMFDLTERFKLTFRSEFFNLSNTPQFDPGTLQGTLGNGGFGRLTGTISGAERKVQFALRLAF